MTNKETRKEIEKIGLDFTDFLHFMRGSIQTDKWHISDVNRFIKYKLNKQVNK